MSDTSLPFEPSLPLEPRALLEQASWVRSLARQLVSDESQADDLAQETLLAALDAPPREPGGLRAWLATVLRYRARTRYRSETRRRAREQSVAQAEFIPPASEVVERAELHRKLVDVVLTLPDPYRATILLRYFDGLDDEQIARQLGIEPATVRSRVKRGIDRLRERLDTDYGNREGWFGGVAILAGIPDLAWQAAATSGAAATAASSATSAATTSTHTSGLMSGLTHGLATGGLLMSTKTLLISTVSALVIVGGAFFLYQGDEPHDPSPGPHGSPSGTPVAGTSQEPSAPGSATSDARGESVGKSSSEDAPTLDRALVSTAGTGTLSGRITDEDGAPLSQIVVHAIPPVDPATAGLHGDPLLRELNLDIPPLEDTTLRTETDPSGRYSVTGLEPGVYSLVARGGGFRQRLLRSLEIKAGGTTTADLNLLEGFVIEGIVLDPDGSPADGAAVAAAADDFEFSTGDGQKVRLAASIDGANQEVGRIRDITGRDGRFRLEGLAPGNHRLTATHERWAASTVSEVAAGSRDVEISLKKGGAISGVVLDPDGRPVEAARIGIRAFPPEAAARTETDRHGRFLLQPLAPGMTQVSVSADGYPTKTSRGVQVVEGETTENLEIQLAEPCQVTGVVLDPGGEPLGKATVRVGVDGPFFFANHVVTTDEDGKFTMPGLAAERTYKGNVDHAKYIAADIDAFTTPTGTFDLGEVSVRAGSKVSGRILDPEGQAVAGASVRLESLSGQNPGIRMMVIGQKGDGLATRSKDDGTFLIAPVKPGTYRVRVDAAGFAHHRAQDLTVTEGAAIPTLVIEMSEGLAITGVVVDGAGQPLAGAQVEATADHGPEARAVQATTDADGAFRLSGLEDSPHQVVAAISGLAPQKFADVRPGGPGMRILLLAMGSVSGMVFDRASGKPIPEFAVKVTPQEEEGARFGPPGGGRGMSLFGQGEKFNDPAGEFHVADLEPGLYDLQVRSQGFVLFEQKTVEIVSGEDLRLELPLEIGGAVEGVVLDHTGKPVVGANVRLHTEGAPQRTAVMISMTAHGDDDATPSMQTMNLGDTDGATTDEEGKFVLMGLPPGEITLAVKHSAYLDKKIENVRVVQNETRQVDRIELEQGATLTGTVYDAEGEPVKHGAVLLTAITEDGAPGRPVFLMLQKGGKYSRSGLKSGKYGINVHNFGSATGLRIGGTDFLAEVELDPGETRKFDIHQGE